MTSQASRNNCPNQGTSSLFLRLVLNGVSFPARRHSRLLSCGRTHGFRPAQAPSANDLLGCHREYPLALVGAASQLQEVFGLSHLLQEGFGASDRACRREKGRGIKLATEDSNPVGSGEIIYSSFSYYLIFCFFTSASPACAGSRVWACSHTPFSETWLIPPLSTNESEKGPSVRAFLSSSSN